MVTLQPQQMPSLADRSSSRLQQQPALTANGSCFELMTSSPPAGDPEHSLFAINKTLSSGSSSSSNASSYVLCSAAAGQAVEPVMQPAIPHVASSSRTAASML
jgi:hypothetical protein